MAWLIYKSLPEALKSKNENLKEELNKVQEQCRVAEDRLAFAEKKLQTFKGDLQKMQEESQNRIKALKEELQQERTHKQQFLNAKTAREIENMRLNLKNEIEEKIAVKALILAENLLKNNSSLPDFNQNIVKNTLNLIEINPQLLKN